eukprot:m.479436 g.479436  ORF g.479436 m.479436 type:complete len:64 (+) comp49788_c0_seq1:205-396(+)
MDSAAQYEVITVHEVIRMGFYMRGVNRSRYSPSTPAQITMPNYSTICMSFEFGRIDHLSSWKR